MSLLAAIAVAVAGPADRWVPIGGDGAASRDVLDTESIKRQGPIVTVWTRRDFPSAKRTAWHEFEIDCSAKQNTILAYIEDEGGSVAHNVVHPHRERAAIAPDSVEERIFLIVCQ